MSYKKELKKYEIDEISKFRNVYYVGNIANKHHNDSFIKKDRYEYKFSDHLKYRYEILAKLGKGAYSDVVKVKDHKDDQIKAVKMLKNFKNHDYTKELKILELLELRKESKKITNDLTSTFYEIFDFRKHTFIVMPLYSKNIFEHRLRIYNGSFNDILTVIKDMFLALEFLRNGRDKIIHGDLKPENILFKNNDSFNIVITDFGLSEILKRDYIYEYKKIYQSRYYRAPEIIYNIPFNEKIDIWSVGCIIYELLEDNPLFYSKQENDHLIYIHSILGSPSKEFIDSSSKIAKFYDSSYYPLKITTELGTTLSPGAKYFVLNELLFIKYKLEKYHMLIKIIIECLDYNSETRISCYNALKIIKKIENMNKPDDHHK